MESKRFGSCNGLLAPSGYYLFQWAGYTWGGSYRAFFSAMDLGPELIANPSSASTTLYGRFWQLAFPANKVTMGGMHVILQDRFCEKLKRILEMRSITQVEFAHMLGITQPVVHRYLSGKVCPGLDLVERFANALGIPPHILIDESDVTHYAEPLLADSK